MSLTSHEEIGRFGRVGGGCYEDSCEVVMGDAENGPVEFKLYPTRRYGASDSCVINVYILTGYK